MCIIDFGKDMVTLKFLATNCRSTYICHVTVSKMIGKHQAVFPLLVNLRKDTSASRNLGITHLPDQNLCISSEKGIFVKIQAADAFVKNNHNPAPFFAVTFYRYA